MSFSSFLLSSPIDLRPMFANNGLAGASNALLVIIRTALFCSFWSLSMSVVLQHPQTEEQYLKRGFYTSASMNYVVEIVFHA